VYTAGSVAGLSAQLRWDARSYWSSVLLRLLSLGSIWGVSGAGSSGARGCLYLTDNGPACGYV
jgi:hypothetical protein